jgi:hypothetical protein
MCSNIDSVKVESLLGRPAVSIIKLLAPQK